MDLLGKIAKTLLPAREDSDKIYHRVSEMQQSVWEIHAQNKEVQKEELEKAAREVEDLETAQKLEKLAEKAEKERRDVELRLRDERLQATVDVQIGKL